MITNEKRSCHFGFLRGTKEIRCPSANEKKYEKKKSCCSFLCVLSLLFWIFINVCINGEKRAKYAKLTNNNRLTVLDDCDVAIVKGCAVRVCFLWLSVCMSVTVCVVFFLFLLLQFGYACACVRSHVLLVLLLLLLFHIFFVHISSLWAIGCSMLMNQ